MVRTVALAKAGRERNRPVVHNNINHGTPSGHHHYHCIPTYAYAYVVYLADCPGHLHSVIRVLLEGHAVMDHLTVPLA